MLFAISRPKIPGETQPLDGGRKSFPKVWLLSSFANCHNRQAATPVRQMKERLRLLNQSATTNANLLHFGHTIRSVSETDFAFVTTIEKSTSACCSATASLLFRNPAVVPLAPVCPVSRFEMHHRQDASARRSTTASTDWENAATGCVYSGQ
jgi:hypothetical protein